MRFVWLTICLLFLSGHVDGQRASAQEELSVNIAYYQAAGDGILIDETGVARGHHAEKVQAYLSGKGVSYAWRIQPWSRLYREAQKSSDTLLYNLLRIDEREGRFHWLLKIQQSELYLVTRNEASMRTLTMADILAGDYRAVCDHSSAQCTILENTGFPEGRILKAPSGVEHSDVAKLVLSGRADFMVSNKKELEVELAGTGLDPDQLFQMFKVYSTATYLAAPKSISPELLEALTED